MPPGSCWLAHAGLLGALACGLAWSDVLPGGWRLRGLIDPPAAQRAREVALHASERLRELEAESPRSAAETVFFLGSSTIERMPLAELFPGRSTSNRGIASADARLLERLVPRLLPPGRVGGIVLYAGSSDWREEGLELGEVAQRVGRLLAALRERCPGSPIVLLGVLPERDPARATELDQLNAALLRLAGPDGLGLRFLPTTRPPLSSTSGALAEECSSDALHLNGAGYRQLARWLVEEGGEIGRRLAP